MARPAEYWRPCRRQDDSVPCSLRLLTPKRRTRVLSLLDVRGQALQCGNVCSSDQAMAGTSSPRYFRACHYSYSPYCDQASRMGLALFARFTLHAILSAAVVTSSCSPGALSSPPFWCQSSMTPTLLPITPRLSPPPSCRSEQSVDFEPTSRCLLLLTTLPKARCHCRGVLPMEVSASLREMSRHALGSSVQVPASRDTLGSDTTRCAGGS